MRASSEPKIDVFKGEYDFLSNYHVCPVTYHGLTYSSSEAAFQSMKTLDPEKRKKFTTVEPDESKRLGKRVELREDWEDIKAVIMYEIVEAKFLQNPDLMKKLLETGNRYLIEGTLWHDNTWGNCTCPKCASIPGKNILGKILMLLRTKFRETQ